MVALSLFRGKEGGGLFINQRWTLLWQNRCSPCDGLQYAVIQGNTGNNFPKTSCNQINCTMCASKLKNINKRKTKPKRNNGNKKSTRQTNKRRSIKNIPRQCAQIMKWTDRPTNEQTNKKQTNTNIHTHTNNTRKPAD